MNLTSLALGAVALLVSSSACHVSINGSDGVQGDGVSKTETRDVAAFQAIEVDGLLTLDLATGPQAVSIAGDENLLPFITTTVTAGKLVLGTSKAVNLKAPLVVTIHAPNVTRLEVNGAAKVNATGLHGGSFALTTDGAAEATLAGAVNRLDVSVGGAGSIHASALVVREAKVNVAGAGGVEVNASEKLKADVSGVGVVRHRGGPTVEKNVSGMGSVAPLT